MMRCSYPLRFEQVCRGGGPQVEDVSSKDAPQKQLQALAVVLYGIQLPVKHQAPMKPPEASYMSLDKKALCATQIC